MTRNLLVPFALALAAAACSSSGSSAAGDGNTTLTLSSTALTMSPGQERYVCWNTTLAPDGGFAVTGLVPHMPARTTHHYVVLLGVDQNGSPDPTMATHPDGEPYDCPASTPQPWLAVGGAGAPPASFPDGTGLKLAGGTRIALQLHLLNTTSDSVNLPAVSLDMTGTTDQDGLASIGLVNVATGNINVPPKAVGAEAVASCTLSHPLQHVFSLYPHMHLLGKHIQTTAVRAGASSPETMNTIDWDFYSQLMYPQNAGLAAGDKITVTCQYDNPNDYAVKFGASSKDEMCSSIVYYYPADQPYELCPAHPFGGPPPGAGGPPGGSPDAGQGSAP
jgi:hypothetical protein